ncbi:SDR family NAD(P)-dependent oxidoreductase [Streptomyces sp. CA-111067]|uniref:SDR family NAD(P)-dependent oxidoreductase n=1 Tax=Streptomyces sp. CA-111067 TaxID=3240046 RepID=UPI003D97EE21
MTRTVLITGATSGLGLATAERFAADGATVFITGRHEESVTKAAAQLGGRARGFVCDAADPQQAAALPGRLGAGVGLDVLVNAAGGLPEAPAASGAGPAAASDPDADRLAAIVAEWDSSLRQNLLTAVVTTTAVRHRLVPGAAVISIGSIGAERRGGSYGAAKAALAAWNATLSAELAPTGVTANVISPGYIENTNFFRGAMTPERRAALIAETHDKRPGAPEDVAEAAFFLASAGARHVTGQTIHVNGGAYTTR